MRINPRAKGRDRALTCLRRRMDPKLSDDFVFPDARNICDKYDIFLDEEGGSHQDQTPSPHQQQIRDAMLQSIGQNSDLVHQNESLIRQIESKNKEIEKLKLLIDACEPVPGLSAEKFQKLIQGSGDDNVDYRDSKIVALAKKIRTLTLAVNKEKALCSAQSTQLDEANRRCDTLQKELDAALLNGRAGSNRSHRRGKDANEGDVEKLQNDLVLANKSIDDLKRRCTQSSDEVKNLTRALARELGDGVSIEQAVDGGWRGRAQQIIMLKSKIKKLEAGVGITSQSTRSRNDVDSKAEEDLAYMSNERKQAVEALIDERGKLAEQCQALETKQRAHKARIRTLENEVSKHKQQLQILIEKTENDDELISALQEENFRLKDQLKARTSAVEEGSQKKDGGLKASSLLASRESRAKEDQAAAEISQNLLELQRLRRLCKQQAEQLNTQDDIIRQLRAGRPHVFGDERTS